MITAQRSPQPRLAAIYLLMPTSQNVELVLRDHGSATPAASSSRLSKKKDSGPPPAQAEGPKYASAYLNFIDGELEPSLLTRKRGRQLTRVAGLPGISDGLVERLTAGLPDNYLQALKELYTNFHGTLHPSSASGAFAHTARSPPTALEARVFSLKMPRSFFTLYAPPDHSPQDSLHRWEDEIGWMSRAVRRLGRLRERAGR